MRKRLLQAWAIILVIGLLLSCVVGCGKTEPKENKTELFVSPTATFTPTPTPTPTPRRTPLPTQEFLSEEEIENDIKLLGIKNAEEIVQLWGIDIAYYTFLNEKGEEVPCVSFVRTAPFVKNNEKFWGFYDAFTFVLIFYCYDDESIKYLQDFVNAPIETDIKKLKNLDFKQFLPIVHENVTSLKDNFGVELVENQWFWRMDYNISQGLDYSAPIIEFARGYIEIVPRKYRTNAATFIDDPVITPTGS